MADSDFEVGDVVELKSGGPEMTVSFIKDGKRATCVWFKDFEPQFETFNVQVLKKIREG